MNAIDLIIKMIPIFIVTSIGFLLRQRLRKRSQEPEQDERTQKLAVKAA